MLVARERNFIRLLVGGDNGALLSRHFQGAAFPEAAKFGVRITIDSISVGRFTFLSHHVEPGGAWPDLVKVATKILERRYPARQDQRLAKISTYQTSIQDLIAQIDETEQGHVRAIDSTLQRMHLQRNRTWHFIKMFASSTPKTIADACRVHLCVILPTEHPGPWSGRYMCNF